MLEKYNRINQIYKEETRNNLLLKSFHEDQTRVNTAITFQITLASDIYHLPKTVSLATVATQTCGQLQENSVFPFYSNSNIKCDDHV